MQNTQPRRLEKSPKSSSLSHSISMCVVFTAKTSRHGGFHTRPYSFIHSISPCRKTYHAPHTPSVRTSRSLTSHSLHPHTKQHHTTHTSHHYDMHYSTKAQAREAAHIKARRKPKRTKCTGDRGRDVTTAVWDCWITPEGGIEEFWSDPIFDWYHGD